MSYRKPLRTIALLVAGLTLTFGNAHAQASSPVGAYTLVRINGQELPVVTETDGDCTEEVISGTLTVAEDLDWVFDYLERDRCRGEVEEDREREGGEYTVDGQTVRFSTETEELDPTDLDIGELAVGVMRSGELTVTLEDGQTVLLFRR